jgi:hypothetical protein
MAVEFNQKNVRRRGGLLWTAKMIAVRWSNLNRIERNREKELAEVKIRATRFKQIGNEYKTAATNRHRQVSVQRYFIEHS